MWQSSEEQCVSFLQPHPRISTFRLEQLIWQKLFIITIISNLLDQKKSG